MRGEISLRSALRLCHASALLEIPWCTWIADRRSECEAAHRTSASSSTIESIPPESPTATREHGGTCTARAAEIAVATARSASARVEFLEFAITQQLVLSRFQQRVDGLLL